MAQDKRPARSVLKRGDEARETLRKEQEAAAARREASQSGAYRFFIGKDNRGRYNTHEVVILDDDARNAPYAYEHSVAGPGNDFSKTKQWICVDEVDNCVLCRAKEQNLGEEYKAPSYNMYVSILDLTPYTIKNGPRQGQVIEATRKLLVIPQGSVSQFLKIFELCHKQNGTTRGCILKLTKERKQDARCGIPQMHDNGMLFDMEEDSEDFLADYANEKIVRDGKTIREEGEDIEPYDYEEILAPPDQKLIRQFYNLPINVGSEDDEAATTGTSRRGRRRAGDGTARSEGDAEEAGGEAPPPRTRRQRAAQAEEGAGQAEAPSPRRGRQRAAPEPEEAGGDEAEEQPRRRRRPQGEPQEQTEDYDEEIPF